jgi:hypothetical protein
MIRIETKRDATRRQMEVVVERTGRVSLARLDCARRGGIRDFVSTRRRAVVVAVAVGGDDVRGRGSRGAG